MKKSIILLHRMGIFVAPRREDNYLHSLTISVKDENGLLFDFGGLPLEFEIEIK